MPKKPDVSFDFMELAHKMPVGIKHIEYCPRSECLKVLWVFNPHSRKDNDGLSRSVLKNGMREEPQFDAALNEGKGGINIGNHRIKAIDALYKLWIESGMATEIPEGIQVRPWGSNSSEWWIPISFGANSSNEGRAISAGIDSNASAMSGNFDERETERLWNLPQLGELLKKAHADGEQVAIYSPEYVAELIKASTPVEPDAATPEETHKKLKASNKIIKCLIPARNLARFEKGLAMTGQLDRSKALDLIMEHYINTAPDLSDQMHADFSQGDL